MKRSPDGTTQIVKVIHQARREHNRHVRHADNAFSKFCAEYLPRDERLENLGRAIAGYEIAGLVQLSRACEMILTH